MGIINYEEIEPLLNTDVQTFMITIGQIKDIHDILDVSGGSLVARMKIKKILRDVVHRMG